MIQFDSITTDGNDYQDTTRVLTFSQNTTRIDLLVGIVDDNNVEGTETFSASLMISLSFPNIILNPSRADIEIIDDDGKLLIATCMYHNIAFKKSMFNN